MILFLVLLVILVVKKKDGKRKERKIKREIFLVAMPLNNLF